MKEEDDTGIQDANDHVSDSDSDTHLMDAQMPLAASLEMHIHVHSK